MQEVIQSVYEQARHGLHVEDARARQESRSHGVRGSRRSVRSPSDCATRGRFILDAPNLSPKFVCSMSRRRSREDAVIVAVAAMRVMQVPRHQVVDVVAVRNSIVTTTCSVYMSLHVSGAGVRRRTRGRIGRTDLKGALVHVTVVIAVKVAIVEVVDVVSMANCKVSAIGSVDVIVMGMRSVAHDSLPPYS